MPRLASITSQQLTVLGTVAQAAIEPVYNSFAFAVGTVNEGGTATATLSTANIDDGTTVDYTVTGISANDVTAGSPDTGTLTINSNTATVSWTFAEDGLTEGTDTITVTLAATDSAGNSTGSLSTSQDILDTSNDPTRTPWLDDNDDIVTVRSIISPVAMQLNAAFAQNPTVPVTIEGRTSGATTTITNIAANTGTILEVDDDGNSTSFTPDEELNLVL